MAGKRRFLRRLGILLLVLVVALAALLFTYAYWLPMAARPLAERYGVTYRTFERAEDGRFVLTDVVRTNALFDLRISRVEGFLPHVWYSKAKADNTNETTSYLEVNGWRLTIHDRKDGGADGGTNSQASVYERWQKVEESITRLREWLPEATLLNGSVVYKKKDYSFSVVTWDHGVLDATGTWPISAVPIEIKGRLTGEGPYQLSYAMHPLDFRVRLRVVETNQMLRTQLAAFYKDNRADLSAQFATNGLLPQTATLKATDFKFSGDLFKLTQYSEITGSLAGEWKTNRYSVTLKAHAEPYSDATNFPPADVDFAAQGDTNKVRVERAVSTIPGLQLAISDPLEVSYRGEMLSERSEIRVNAELEKLPWLKLKGRVEGTILLEKGSQLPIARFNLGGADLSGYQLEAESLRAQGRLEWPRLEDFRLEARLATNATLSLSGSADLKTRTLGETLLQADGPVATNLLPAGVSFSHIRLKANLSGDLAALSHSGELELRDFAAPQINPLTVEASWKAEQLEFDALDLRARAGPAAVFISGSGYAGGGRTNFVIRELSFFKGDELYLQLAEASRLTITTNSATRRPQLELHPITLLGTNRSLAVSGGLAWPQAGALDLRATNVNPSLFQYFVTRSLSGLEVEWFNLAGRWSNGPLAGTVAGAFSIEQPPFERLTAAVDAHLESSGLKIENFKVSSPAGEILRASGSLPLTLAPAGTNRIYLSPSENLDFEVATASNPALWKTVASLSRLSLSNATARLSIHGPVRNPTGELRLQASSIEYQQTNQILPAIGPIDGRVLLNEQVLRIPNLAVRIEDQPFTLSAQLPLGDQFWRQRREELLRYALTNSEVMVQAPEVKIAPFTAYLPEYLRPQGELFINAELKPGRNLSGRIQVLNVETRPLPRLGVVQDIEAELLLQGQKMEIANMSAVLGGERVSLGGRIDLSPESLARSYPDLDLSLAGYNLPLARNPDVILRSDLNLRLTNGPNRVPVISGTAQLRDSFLLRDITTLVPGRVAGPERRPPYFTVPQEPLDDWRLDVRVRGENFMRVRSPFFQGVVSANFHVVGTLEEPMALGEAAITSGRLIFPFATLEVRQALVSLASENPYLPHLFVVAAGRAFGFDIRMEAEGPADEPVIEFSSVPALTSEQIVLMLTTGQIPREDFSFSTEDRASRLAFFLGKSLWTKLNPGQPAEERLTIRSGQDVTEQGRQTYEVEYKLNDRWSLVGEYDRFGELNANVKWRLFSR